MTPTARCAGRQGDSDSNTQMCRQGGTAEALVDNSQTPRALDSDDRFETTCPGSCVSSWPRVASGAPVQGTSALPGEGPVCPCRASSGLLHGTHPPGAGNASLCGLRPPAPSLSKYCSVTPRPLCLCASQFTAQSDPLPHVAFLVFGITSCSCCDNNWGIFCCVLPFVHFQHFQGIAVSVKPVQAHAQLSIQAKYCVCFCFLWILGNSWIILWE